jgi:hypothetical protein
VPGVHVGINVGTTLSLLAVVVNGEPKVIPKERGANAGGRMTNVGRPSAG